MRKLLVILAVMVLGPVTAYGYAINCLQEGPGTYAYVVTVDPGEFLWEVYIGSDSTNIFNLTGPAGTLGVVLASDAQSKGPYVPDGSIATESGNCAYEIRFYNFFVGSGTYTFSFDCPDAPQVVGWTLGWNGLPTTENWAVAVGNANVGPVHGPVPEPSTYVLFALGMSGLWTLRRRSKK